MILVHVIPIVSHIVDSINLCQLLHQHLHTSQTHTVTSCTLMTYKTDKHGRTHLLLLHLFHNRICHIGLLLSRKIVIVDTLLLYTTFIHKSNTYSHMHTKDIQDIPPPGKPVHRPHPTAPWPSARQYDPSTYTYIQVKHMHSHIHQAHTCMHTPPHEHQALS